MNDEAGHGRIRMLGGVIAATVLLAVAAPAARRVRR